MRLAVFAAGANLSRAIRASHFTRMPKLLSLNVLVWLILAFIWSTTWIFIKLGLADLPPIAFSSARFLLAAAVLFVIIRLQGITLPKTAPEWRLIALTGVL